MTLTTKLLSTAALVLAIGSPAVASAEEPNEVFAMYDHYQAGYDNHYSDDWFFDHYEYDADGPDPYFDYYSDFDYQHDLFQWEEIELFEDARKLAEETHGQR